MARVRAWGERLTSLGNVLRHVSGDSENAGRKIQDLVQERDADAQSFEILGWPLKPFENC